MPVVIPSVIAFFVGLPLLISKSPTQPTYKPLSGVIQERLEARYSGYLPVLGGQTGNAVATVILSLAPGKSDQGKSDQGKADPAPAATPVAPPGSGDFVPTTVKPQAFESINTRLNLIDFKLTFNGFGLPISPESARKFFPGFNFSIDPSGKLLKSNLPDVHVPFRLPGLEVSRVPELAFIPIQFPADPLEIGKVFKNQSETNGETLDLEVTPTEISAEQIKLSFTRKESYTVLEDSSNSVVPDSRDAVNKVETTVTGTGTAIFDLSKGRFTSYTSTDSASSQVTELATNKVSVRKLKRTLSLSAP